MVKRAEIRKRHNIQGSFMHDCCTTYWCPVCSLIQQDKEVKTHIALNTGGYQAEGPMSAG